MSIFGKKYFQNKKLPNTFNLFVQATVEFWFFAGPSSNILPYFTSGHEHGIISTAMRLAWSLV